MFCSRRVVALTLAFAFVFDWDCFLFSFFCCRLLWLRLLLALVLVLIPLRLIRTGHWGLVSFVSGVGRWWGENGDKGVGGGGGGVNHNTVTGSMGFVLVLVLVPDLVAEKKRVCSFVVGVIIRTNTGSSPFTTWTELLLVPVCVIASINIIIVANSNMRITISFFLHHFRYK